MGLVARCGPAIGSGEGAEFGLEGVVVEGGERIEVAVEGGFDAANAADFEEVVLEEEVELGLFLGRAGTGAVLGVGLGENFENLREWGSPQ